MCMHECVRVCLLTHAREHVCIQDCVCALCSYVRGRECVVAVCLAGLADTPIPRIHALCI